MAIKIAKIDWRSDTATWQAQVDAINVLLQNVDLTHWLFIDEWVTARYTTPRQGNVRQLKIFDLVGSIESNGIPQTESDIQTFIRNKTVIDFQPLDEGFIMVIYE